MKSPLVFNNVTKEFKDFKLDGTNFELKKGYITGLIGNNGAGKTTIMNLILGSYLADSGSVELFGNSIQDYPELQNKIGYVPEKSYLFEDFKLYELAKFYKKFYFHWDDNEFYRLVEKYQLPLKKKYSKLSKGMKKKFYIATALSHNAELLILDEPADGLDPTFRKCFMHDLQEFIENGERTVFLSTHITSDLEGVVDQILFIRNGQILMDKPYDEIFENALIIKSEQEKIISNRALFEGIHDYGYGMEALSLKANELPQDLIKKSVTQKPTLQDIMYFLS